MARWRSVARRMNATTVCLPPYGCGWSTRGRLIQRRGWNRGIGGCRRTLALELPGHGLSSKDVGTGDAALFTVIEATLVALDVERVHVVGHSMGGALAVLLAARRPERIATLTLLAPARLRPEINSGFIDAIVRASRGKGCGGGIAVAGARRVTDQSRDGGGSASLQASGWCGAGAGRSRARGSPGRV
jgi:pimeloyl-ACP methyl ester carboxylesterase